MSSLQFLLFGEGTADPNAWRPAKDDSMWWMRRDALVRCLGASAFAGADVHYLLQDRSMLRVGNNIRESTPIPTEAAVLYRIKNALKSDQGADGVRCHRWVEPAAAQNSSTQPHRTKREVVRSIQQAATPEFLRKWRLNASEAVVLKKCSGAHVEKAAADWAAVSEHGGAASPVTQVLRGLRPGSMVLLLHEDYPSKLPLFERGSTDEAPSCEGAQCDVLCVMGAVKDASPEELAMVQNGCTQLGITLRSCNLGRSAQFTSKIIASIVGHWRCGALHPAAKLLSEHPNQATRLRPARAGEWSWDGSGAAKLTDRTIPAADRTTHEKPSPEPFIDYILKVAVRADQIVLDPERRGLCQPVTAAIVNCLWKSCAVAEGATHPHRLTVWFECGALLTLTADFIQKLASRKMAAPTELHVLTVLTEILSEEAVPAHDAVLSDLVARHKVGSCGVLMMNAEPPTQERGAKFLLNLYGDDKSQDGQLESAVVLVGFDKAPKFVSRQWKVSKAFCSTSSPVVLLSLAHSWILSGQLPLSSCKEKKKNKKRSRPDDD